MNYRVVARNIGIMLLLLAVAMGTCLTLGYILPPGRGHSGETALTGWEISMAITAAAGLALFTFGHAVRGRDILQRDAIGIVGLGWLICSVFAALPYLFCSPKLGAADAYFEAVSGLTTTGATTFGELATVPETILLWRSLTQWIGGMGILAMFVLVLGRLGASGRSMFQTESSAHMRELRGTRMREIVLSLWALYVVLTCLCALGLWILGMTPFQAVNHSMTAVSTGGFGTEPDSINGFGPAVRLWLLAFMFGCGVSFPLYIVMIRRGRDWNLLRRHEETWWFAIALVVVSIALFLDRTLAGGIQSGYTNEFIDTAFMAVSVATTTGFVVGDYDTWPMLAKGLLLFVMIMGGCAGSTAGGLKVSRLILWFKMLRIEIRRAYRPNELVGLKLNGRPVPAGTRGQLFTIITSATACVAIGSYLVAGLEPDLSVDGCISAVLTAVSNVGPGFNEFGPTQNFSALSDPSKFILSGLMVLGRLEYIAVMVLFSRTLWKRY